MSGITADGAARYLANLDAEEDAAVRQLEKVLAVATTQDEKDAVRARIKQVREDFARRKRAATQSLF
jgi:hypothetical protein